MSPWLLRLLGFDASRIPADAQWKFAFTSAPQSWHVFLMAGLVVALVYGVLFLYRREIDSCPLRVRVALGLLRAGVLVILALVFLRPALTYSQSRTVQPYVVLMLDDSLSMSIPDRYLDDSSVAAVANATGRSPEAIRAESPTRAALVNELLAKDQGALVQSLSQIGKLRVVTFSNKVQTLELKPQTAPDAEKPKSPPPAAPKPDSPGNQSEPGREEPRPEVVIPPLKPVGQGTLIAKAIRSALKDLAGNPVAGIILVSDGQDTAKDDNAADAAKSAADQRVPIFTVGVGDPSKPRNLRVADMYADEQVWHGDPFEIQATIQSQGLAGGVVAVELTEQLLNADGQPSGEPSLVERREVTLPADGAQAGLVFKHKPKKVGQYVYTVQVPIQPGELLDTDNAKSVQVRVLKEQARVLLIAGDPSWEYRFVQALYTRDPSINVSAWLQTMDLEMPQEGDTPIDKLPYTFDQLNKYDLVMMFDPDPSEFNEAWFEMLKRFLDEHAGGFLYMAGPKFSSRFLSDPRSRGLRDILPVRLGEASAMELESLTSKSSREWPLAVVPSNLDHPIMRFDTDASANQTRWERMPGIYWHFPTSEAKPAARTLLEHSDPNLRGTHGARPLLVTGQYGSGRTAFMGFNGTWRWRRVGKEAEYFNKYWVQVCRYLVEGKLLANKRRGSIETGGEKFHVGDTVKIAAHLLDPAFEPLAVKSVSAIVKAGTAEVPLELKPVRGQPGNYEATLVAAQLGLNEVAISLPGDKPETTVRVAKQFEVELPRVEFEDTRLNKALLRDIAEKTDGKYFEIDQLSELADAIPTDRTETIVVAGKPADLWDTDRLLVLLVVLLTVEWGVRKRFKLM